MTIKKLIKILQREPQNAQVLLGLTTKSPGSEFIHYDGENYEEHGADYDGMNKFTSNGNTTIVLRPSLTRIKKI